MLQSQNILDPSKILTMVVNSMHFLLVGMHDAVDEVRSAGAVDIVGYFIVLIMKVVLIILQRIIHIELGGVLYRVEKLVVLVLWLVGRFHQFQPFDKVMKDRHCWRSTRDLSKREVLGTRTLARVDKVLFATKDIPKTCVCHQHQSGFFHSCSDGASASSWLDP